MGFSLSGVLRIHEIRKNAGPAAPIGISGPRPKTLRPGDCPPIFRNWEYKRIVVVAGNSDRSFRVGQFHPNYR